MSSAASKIVFSKVDKDELSQVSLTGLRAIVLCGLLMDAPRSIEEIRTHLIEFNLMEPEHSNDIIRIDINSLKAIGCEISRASKSTNYKYVLKNHPFSIQITNEEVNLLKRTYNQIKNNVDIITLLKYDNLFRKIAVRVTDNEIKESLCGISLLKSIDIDKLNNLANDCKYNRVIKLLYQPPYSRKPEEKEIATKQLVMKNDKIYIYGFDINLKQAVTLHFKRIKDIISRQDDCGYKIKPVNVKFIIGEFGAAGLLESENIIERNDRGYVIEGSYHNEFLAIQRILSLGSTCTVLSPSDFRDKIIVLLKKMKEIYNE